MIAIFLVVGVVGGADMLFGDAVAGVVFALILLGAVAVAQEENR